MSGRYDVDPGQTKGQKGFLYQFAELEDIADGHKKSLKIGHTSIEEGDLILKNGNILVYGSLPSITFFPLAGSSTRIIELFGSNDDAFLKQTLTLLVQTLGGVADGGKIILAEESAILSHHPLASGGNESYLWFNIDPTVDEIMSMQGKWPNQFQYSTLQAIYPGVINVGAGFTSYTHTYFSAFATTMAPVVCLNNSGGTVSWNLTAQSTSSFTVAWAGTAAKTLNFWAFRV